MRGCAFGECTDPNCYFCVVMKKKFPPIVPCPCVLQVDRQRRRCRLVYGHKPPCRPVAGKRGVVETSEEDAWWK